jgi:HK97 gp10 family phage protein
VVDVVFEAGFEQALFDDSRDFMAETADRVKTVAKLYCPVDTWRLHNSIDVVPFNYLDGVATAEGELIGTSVEYGIYQELGTRKMSAQPYLRPALDEVMRTV